MIRPTEGSSANVSASADSAACAPARNPSVHLVKFSDSRKSDFGLGEKHYTNLRERGKEKEKDGVGEMGGGRERRESGSIDVVI